MADSGSDQPFPDGTQRWNRTVVMLAIDIVGFGDLDRDDRIREHLHQRMHEMLRSAIACTGIDPAGCYFEDRGDGAIALLPGPDSLPENLEPLIEALHRELVNHNHASRFEAAIRLRVSVHVGDVTHDQHGLVSPEVIHLFWLLDSPPPRDAVKRPERSWASSYRPAPTNCSACGPATTATASTVRSPSG